MGRLVAGTGSYSFVKTAEGDPKYHTNLTADTQFDVALDITAGTMTLAPHRITTMWMIGDAVGGWNFDENAISMPLSTDEDSVVTWAGDLSAGDLKFCSIWWEYNKNAFGAAEGSTELKAGSLAVQTIDSNDRKFSVATAGKYSLTLNLKTMTLTVTGTTPTDVISVGQYPQPAKVIRNGQVYILRGDALYDLTGRRQ